MTDSIAYYGKVVSTKTENGPVLPGPGIRRKLWEETVDRSKRMENVNRIYTNLIVSFLQSFGQQFPFVDEQSIANTQLTKMPPNCTYAVIDGVQCIIELECFVNGKLL